MATTQYTSGPLTPASVVDAGGGGIAWTSPGNATLEDAVVATSGLIGPGGGGGIPNQLNASNFSLNIPSIAIIDGIKVEYKVQSGASAVGDRNIHLETTGGVVTASAATLGYGTNSWPTGALTWLTLGGSTSLWGRTWTPAEINSASFLASINGFPGTGTGTISVDSIRVTVYYHFDNTVAAADVPKRYLYKVFNGGGVYIGNLQNVISEFAYPWDINTAGSQITIECALSADTALLPGSYITDEAGNRITDEANNELMTEGQPPVLSIGSATNDILIKNGNLVQVFEYSYYYPNGKQMFSGQINRIEASYGASESIKMVVLHDGQDLDNFIARGSPFTYVADQSQTVWNVVATVSDSSSGGKGLGWNRYGQTFIVGAGVTKLGAITLALQGAADVTVSVYSDISVNTLLGTVTQHVDTSGAALAIQFAFPSLISVAPGSTYFFTVSVDGGQSITIYYNNANPYASGAMHNSSYGGGGGGGWSAFPANSDLYFVTASGAGTTTATYSSVDPSTGMLKPIIDDYRSRGGLINYGASTVDATLLSLTYTFNTNTVYEAIKAVLSMAPNGFYYYVDLGTDTLYFKKTSTTADITLTRGKHIEDLTLVLSIENIKNQMLFSGGLVSTTNLYTQYQDTNSINLYGVRLQRQSDNRVTIQATADAIGGSFIAGNKDEQYQTTLTVLDKTMDITLFKPGKVIGFNGYGTFVDGLLAQIVRIDYSPHEVKLTLGILPKRFNPEFEKVTRGLVAAQTVANPTAPS